MDVYSLKNYIIDNPDYIELILEETGFHKVTKRGNEYRAALEKGTNPTSVKVNINTLSATSFSTNLNGDLITLVKSKLYTNFPTTIKKIAELIDFRSEEVIEEYKLPFSGFFKNIAKLRSEEPLDLETFSEDILNQFEIMPNLLFYEDGIMPTVQREFGIGYDSVTRRISVPWRSFDGSICGIMGRLNKKEVSEEETKWFPIIPFPKSKTLYGFSENYAYMQEKSIVMIGESEKHSLQLRSKGLNVGLSLGGNFLSEIQANNIKSLFPKTIIIMLDEGIGEDHSQEIARQLKMNNIYKNQVGYVYDKDNMFLPKKSKLAPSDLDKQSINKLIQNCTVWT